jgi:hypothetical protein
MDVYIHKTILGFQQHLVVKDSGKIHKVKEIPDDQLLVFGDPELKEIAKIYNLPLPTFPFEPQLKAFQTVLKGSDQTEVPWHLAMPSRAFRKNVEGLAEALHRTFSGINLDYYRNHYRKTLSFLGRMQPTKIDPRAWMIHKTNPELKTPHVFNSFQPDSNWFTPKVTYSKSDTKTGRLKVTEGPNILHLPKEQRNILTSRFGQDGKVMHLDFRALEPRVVLFINQLSPPLSGNPPLLGCQTVGEDIYQDVLDTLGINDIHRDKVKDVILSQLYGAGYEKILLGLGDVRDPEGFIAAVNDFFGLDKIREQLFQEYEANNREFILSFYGRKLDTREAKPYMLLNYFAQSTAVDVALYGFRNIVRAINGNPLIIPLFVLHDALILDVHDSVRNLLSELVLVGSQNIPLFPGRQFAIKAARF